MTIWEHLNNTFAETGEVIVENYIDFKDVASLDLQQRRKCQVVVFIQIWWIGNYGRAKMDI